MAQGKKTDNETIYKVMLSVFSTNNYSETARQLDMPESTVEKIYKDNKDKPEFVKLCEEKRDDFIEKANQVIEKTYFRMLKALEEEDKIPLNQLATTYGIVCDKKKAAETTDIDNKTPNININIVDNSTDLEKVLYEED